MARRIMVLAGLVVVVGGYYLLFENRNDLIYLVSGALLILVLAYTFQYQINQLVIRGVPQTLPEAMRAMLLHTAPQFLHLPNEEKALMEDRMMRWIMKKDFIQKNDQDAPEDVKFILAYYAAMLTLRQRLYLYESIDRIAFYHHPFLSPAYPEDVHIGEVEATDGTMIISVPHLLKGHLEKGYYNIGLHLMAEAFRLCYVRQPIQWDENIWEQLEAISSITRDQIEAYIGLPMADPWPVAVHHQMMYEGTHIEQVVSLLPHLSAHPVSTATRR